MAPNTIDFRTVFSKFSTIGDNLAVLLTLCGTIILYWVVLLILRRKDKADLERVSTIYNSINTKQQTQDLKLI